MRLQSRRRAKRKASGLLAYKLSAPIGIGSTIKQDKDAESADFKARRAECRAFCFARDHGCCVRCGVPLILDLDDIAHVFQLAHCHEKVPRSLGGDACNPDNCETRCAKCHDHSLPGCVHRRKVL